MVAAQINQIIRIKSGFEAQKSVRSTITIHYNSHVNTTNKQSLTIFKVEVLNVFHLKRSLTTSFGSISPFKSVKFLRYAGGSYFGNDDSTTSAIQVKNILLNEP